MTDRGGLLYGDWSGDWPVADHGEGIFIYDRSGRPFLDAVGGSHVVSIAAGTALPRSLRQSRVKLSALAMLARGYGQTSRRSSWRSSLRTVPPQA